ncbi:hypothetical protein C8F04DRAFT_202594 [Mycena alexandri]|uniref:Uncharacterized protein n=1 Tax=Mycena alexandri TaxID=1745969 RepID=A0AAD6XE27_9AGAR|nr:hypothetical protein C8F04DRAFT_202594 [Mycena alexandri]
MATTIPVPSSPTMSSSSSFDVLSSRSRSSTTSDYFDDSDDEIVWSVSEDGHVERASDDDFVVLSKPQSPIRTTTTATPLSPPPTDGADTLAADLDRLSFQKVSSIIRNNKKVAAAAATTNDVPGTASPKRRKGKPATPRPKSAASSRSSSSSSPLPSPVSDRSVATLKNGGKPGPRRRRNRRGGSPTASLAGGLGARPIVDDISERASEQGDDELAGMSMYEAAASYINSFLADPTSVCRLTLLQSLIVELGLADTSLPPSLTAAKAMLKSHAFLHVGEYLDARQHGPAAVQGVMHKSKTSLIKTLRKNRNPVPLKFVKETGLQVLLVSCYH